MKQNKFLRIMSLCIVTGLLTFLTGCGREDYSYDEWDADSNDLIIESEFNEKFKGSEYYKAWDVNNDGSIDKDEWSAGINDHYPKYDHDTYGYYGDWDEDKDNDLTEEEFARKTFNIWDNDGNGSIDREEYQEWYFQGAD